MDGYHTVRHEFVDADDPQFPLALTDQEREIVRTEVKVLVPGRRVQDDVLLFRHYVRRP